MKEPADLYLVEETTSEDFEQEVDKDGNRKSYQTVEEDQVIHLKDGEIEGTREEKEKNRAGTQERGDFARNVV